ncbi:hypothetical protein [Paludisphaera soli]|uniref:hypothetical protein n=1 Tax=Paludisphaera soli TaxID=2712865 RepID=UPI00198138AF|nr:hypothetical protein [Paludisphaera soli]
MDMNDHDALLARWKALTGDDSPNPWTFDHLAGFFQNFRPLGAGLAHAFEGVAGADEILPRLLEVFRATAEGWSGVDGTYDAYFLVRRPPPLAPPHAIELLRRHLENVKAMAVALGRHDLTAILDPAPPVTVAAGEPPRPPGHDAETMIYEVVGDYMGSLSPRESPMLRMGEAFWTIACDPNLGYHILWPLYRDSGSIEEPFAPYFELWKHGAAYRFTDDGDVRLHTPG